MKNVPATGDGTKVDATKRASPVTLPISRPMLQRIGHGDVAVSCRIACTCLHVGEAAATTSREVRILVNSSRTRANSRIEQRIMMCLLEIEGTIWRRSPLKVKNYKKSKIMTVLRFRPWLLWRIAFVQSPSDRCPIFDQVFRGSPGERLRSQRGIPGAAGAHDGSADNTEIRYFVRESPPIHNVRFGIVSHARATVRVSGHRH